MPIHASDIILDWIAKDGYSLSETGLGQGEDCGSQIRLAAGPVAGHLGMGEH